MFRAAPSQNSGSMDGYSGKVQKTGISPFNIINDLPNHITKKILGHLPIRDAVKTSILSKTWRYKWRDLPRLVFDDGFCRLSSNNTVPAPREILFCIYQVLLLHRGAITDFSLTISHLESCPQFDQLLLFLSDKHIQEFTFSVGGSKRDKLPSCLFSYEQLKHLTLASCTFRPPPTFGGFRALTHLTLDRVTLSCKECETVFAKCPLLEHLKIVHCSNHTTSFMIDFPNLKSLHLESFKELQSICLKNAPRLATVILIDTYYVIYDSKGKPSTLIKGLECLPAVEYLCAGPIEYFLPGISVPPNAINCLKVVELYDVYLHDPIEISWIQCLIMSSPNIQKLRIKAVLMRVEPHPDEMIPCGFPDFLEGSLDQLREVRIDRFRGEVAVYEFVKFLLAKSLALEKLFIQPPPGTAAKKVVEILKEVTQFQRASPKTQIIHLYPDEEGGGS